jgi:hypothetical protein
MSELDANVFKMFYENFFNTIKYMSEKHVNILKSISNIWVSNELLNVYIPNKQYLPTEKLYHFMIHYYYQSNNLNSLRWLQSYNDMFLQAISKRSECLQTELQQSISCCSPFQIPSPSSSFEQQQQLEFEHLQLSVKEQQVLFQQVCEPTTPTTTPPPLTTTTKYIKKKKRQLLIEQPPKKKRKCLKKTKPKSIQEKIQDDEWVKDFLFIVDHVKQVTEENNNLKKEMELLKTSHPKEIELLKTSHQKEMELLKTSHQETFQKAIHLLQNNSSI